MIFSLNPYYLNRVNSNIGNYEELNGVVENLPNK